MYKKYIALTFDDGPNNVVTPGVLDRLEKYNAKATFMLIGQNIKDEFQAVLDRAVRLGCEFANHSYSHCRMTEISFEEVEEEISKTQELIFKHTGKVAKHFRPPFLFRNEKLHNQVDMIFVKGKDTSDWDENVSEQQTSEFVITNAEDGDIFILHDSAHNIKTARSLDTIIPELHSRGFEFVTVSELFDIKGVAPQRGIDYDNVLQEK